MNNTRKAVTKMPHDTEWMALLDCLSDPMLELNLVDRHLLAEALRKAVAHGMSFESALDLPAQWRSNWRRRQRTSCIKALIPGTGSRRHAAGELHRELLGYRLTAKSRSDLAGKTRPRGRHWLLAAVLANNSGRVPSRGTIERALAE